MGGAAGKHSFTSNSANGNHALVASKGASLAILFQAPDAPQHDASNSNGENGSSPSLSSNAIRTNQLGVPCLVRYPYLDFKLLNIIGKGRFSTVYKATSLKDLALKVAIKEIRVQDMNRQQIADLRYELNLLSNLRHVNIARMASVLDPSNGKNTLYVVMEYLCGGEVIASICRQRQYMETDAIRFIEQLSSAVHYLHSHGVVHGKIIPENLILAQPSFESSLRLVDFGISQAETQYHQYYHPNFLHLDEFRIPELPYERRITAAMDVWCVGIIAHIILSGKLPFEGQQTALRPLSKEYSFEEPQWTYVSPDAIDFLCKSLTIDPRERPSMDDLLVHPWVNLQERGKIRMLTAGSPPPSALPPSMIPPEHRQSISPTSSSSPNNSSKKRSAIGSLDNNSLKNSLRSSLKQSSPLPSGHQHHRETFQLEKLHEAEKEEDDSNSSGSGDDMDNDDGNNGKSSNLNAKRTLLPNKQKNPKKALLMRKPTPLPLNRPPPSMRPTTNNNSDSNNSNGSNSSKSSPTHSPTSGSPSSSDRRHAKEGQHASEKQRDQDQDQEEEEILYELDEREEDEDDDVIMHFDLTSILPQIRSFHEARQTLQPVVVFSSTINFAKLGRYMHEKNYAIIGNREQQLGNLLFSSVVTV